MARKTGRKVHAAEVYLSRGGRGNMHGVCERGECYGVKRGRGDGQEAEVICRGKVAERWVQVRDQAARRRCKDALMRVVKVTLGEVKFT